jgi:hypothetical protein
MKKIIILAIATVAALGLSSCASKKTTPTCTESTGAATYGYSK